MPRTIHVTVTYSVHVEDTDTRIKSGKLSAKDAIEWAKASFDEEGKVFDVKAVVFNSWENQVPRVRKGIGSY